MFRIFAVLMLASLTRNFACGRPLRALSDLPESELPARQNLGGSIWDYISSRPDATMFASLVEAAGLVSLLNSTSPEQTMTLFLPLDSAFDSFFQEQGSNLEELINLPGTQDLVGYHMDGKEALAWADLPTGRVLTMLNSEAVSVAGASRWSQGLSLRDSAGRTISVLEWDNQAGNSFVHTIDRLLVAIPPSTIDEALLYNSELSISRDVFNAARFGGLLSATDANVTLLVPTNDAWASVLVILGLKTMDDLLNSTLLPPIASGLILPSVFHLSDLESSAGSRYLKTHYSCSELYTQVEDDGTVVMHGAGASAGQSANIIEDDLVAGKFALIQKLDAVITPKLEWGGRSCRNGTPPMPPRPVAAGKPAGNKPDKPDKP